MLPFYSIRTKRFRRRDIYVMACSATLLSESTEQSFPAGSYRVLNSIFFFKHTIFLADFTVTPFKTSQERHELISHTLSIV
jgi:hypothetical protein